MANSKEKEERISLSDIFDILKLNWVLIAVITLVFTIAVAVSVFSFVPNRYSSTSELLVQVRVESTNPNEPGTVDFTDTQKLIGTAVDLIKSDSMINQVRTMPTISIPDNLTNNQIKRNITITSSSSSFVIRITYTSEDADFAVAMTDALTQSVVSNNIPMFTGVFVVLSDASDAYDDSPSKILYTFLGFIVGLFISFVAVFTKQMLRNSYLNKEQLEEGLKLQVFGVIPSFEYKENK